ncbi:hypothetical protein [Paraburkholderia sp. J94]|uniref:hypothetical protein n=1 Tax=Paraburkholderia sp. J94 TaxID=2805441 RepID=UPI002AAF819F|nr:hypothetical protein [Paraburkholderia sp. J94]
MIQYINDALLAALFPAGTASEGQVHIRGPVAIDQTLEASGIDFDGVRHVVFFADVFAYSGNDHQLVRETAEAWNNGFLPAPNSRLVKFLRAEADAESMFYPGDWPLPDPNMIWQFSEALSMALQGHALAYPETSQYFYMPQTGKLDALYNRLARKFERGEAGLFFRCVTRPASDEGGFYGFERI